VFAGKYSALVFSPPDPAMRSAAFALLSSRYEPAVLTFATGTGVLSPRRRAHAQMSEPVPAGWDALAKQFRDYVRDDGIVGASLLTMRNGRGGRPGRRR
jgi:hypothetical protein